MHSRAATATEAFWPNLIRRGPRGTRDWDRDQEGDWENESELTIMRGTIMALATIADTWVVREVGQQQAPVLNMMKYEELWKAKVLIRVPRVELMKRMNRIYDLRNDAIDFNRKMAALERELEFKIKKRNDEFDFDTRKGEAKLNYMVRLDNHRLDWAIRKAEMEARLGPLPQPTFNFMNNTYWYGYGPLVYHNVGTGSVPIDVKLLAK